MTRKRLFYLLLVIGLGYVGYRVLKPNPLPVEVAPVTRENLTDKITADGQVKATQEAELKFLTTGQVREIKVVEGQEVKKGDLLGSLDKASLWAALQSAQASLRKAEAERDQLYAEYKDLEDTDYRWARKRQENEDVKSAQESVKTAQENLNKANLYSPLDGKVTAVNVKVGEAIVATSGAAFIVSDLSTLIFEVEIDETEIEKVELNQEAVLNLNAFADESFAGQVVFIPPAASEDDAGNPIFEIKIKPDFKEQRIFSGLKGEAAIIISKKEGALSVPYEGIVEDGERYYVWLIEGHQVSKREVRVGRETEVFTEILDGLSEGDLVVISDHEKLKERQLISY